eukprot:GHVS01038473.1.p1 GENE.GHVS01038473.1~~GHVS01038473.1.p1  ORF type:complete len:251 (-),score=50.51 GHVS01038473.1:437-1189(-)
MTPRIPPVSLLSPFLTTRSHRPPLPFSPPRFCQSVRRFAVAVTPKAESQKSAATASATTTTASSTRRRGRQDVPSVLVHFGTAMYQVSFVSHPGVMAVAKLLEMPQLAKSQAAFTLENIEAIREFDEELARKCQVAYDNGLNVNMMDLEHIDRPGYLEALKRDKTILAKARAEVAALPLGGPYPMPKCLADYQAPEQEASWNPQNEIGPEVFEVQPGYRQEVELRGIVKSFLNRQEGNTGRKDVGQINKT